VSWKEPDTYINVDKALTHTVYCNKQMR